MATPPLGATTEATEDMNPETLSLPTNPSSTSSSPLNTLTGPNTAKDRDPASNSPETKGWLYKWTNYIKGIVERFIIFKNISIISRSSAKVLNSTD